MMEARSFSRRYTQENLALRLTVALILMLLLMPTAHAQLPVATGRQYTLSNAAWKVFIPSTYVQRPNSVADVLVHFHGDPQTFYNNAAYANLNAILVTVNYSGLSSAYTTPFSNQSLFQTVLDETLATVRVQRGVANNLTWDQIGVSSFSAGYGAVREILKSSNYRNQIDALLAADSLYATTAGDGTSVDSQMADYKTFANLAKNGSKTFLFSHSQVPTYTYESTGETGDELMQYLGIAPTATTANGLGTLNFYRTAQTGNFRLWGALGADGDSHLEHLRYIGEFLKEMPLSLVPTSPADFDRDGRFDAEDLPIWQASYGVNANADADGDGDTDGRDFLLWQQRVTYADMTPSVVAIPEPSTTLLIAIALLLAGSQRDPGKHR
jgi:hypothetical protein